MPQNMGELAIAGALLLGLTIGWLVGWLQGRANMRAYRQALEDQQGVCWVKAQVDLVPLRHRPPQPPP